MLTQQAVLLLGDRALRWIWFFEKKFWNFFSVRVRTRYKLSLVFKLSPVSSKFKFMLSARIQLFGLKTNSHGKPDLKNSFPKSDLRCGDFRVRLRWKLGYSDTLYSTISPFFDWKPGWACTWSWPWTKKKFTFFSQNQICLNARSPWERTACCVNICPRKWVYQKRQ